MKHIYTSLILLMMVAIMLPSCKKGDEDPAISLLSRKSRLTGEWKVSSYNWSSSSNDENEKYDETLSHEGESLGGSIYLINKDNEVNTSISGVVTEHTFKFESDGSYTMKFYRNMTLNNSDGTESQVRIEEYESGSWNFLGESKNSKAKEMIALTPEKTTYVHTDDMGVLGEEKQSSANNEAKSYRLVRLSNDEIIMESDRGSSTYLVTFGNENEVGQMITENIVLEKK